MSDKVRVMRILVYEGTREWVDIALKGGRVPLEGQLSFGGDNLIKSALIDKFPEILDKQEVREL